MKAQDILKTDGIIRVAPDDTLSHAISQLNSSHDAAFVFSEKGKYMGIVNPYHAVIKHNKFQGGSLVEHTIFHPPRISPDDSLERIISLMAGARVYYLPVVNKKGIFEGVVSARRILAVSKDNPVYRKQVFSALQEGKKRPLVSVYEDEKMSHAINVFDVEDVSKLVVIDKAMKLQGILSYYDMLPHLIAPSEREDNRRDRLDKVDEFADLKVVHVMQSLVHTCLPEATLKDCLEDMLSRTIGSIVIMNPQGFPSGIITIRDLLEYLDQDEEEFFIELSTANVSETSMETIMTYGPRLERWIEKKKVKDGIQRAMMFIKEEKNGGVFKITLTLMPTRGKPIVYTEEGKNLLDVLQSINKHN